MPTFHSDDFEAAEGEELKPKDGAVPPVEEENEGENPEGGDKLDQGGDQGQDPGTEGGSEAAPFTKLEIDLNDLPADLRDKIKSGKDLVTAYDNTRRFAQDLYNRIGETQQPPKKEEEKPKQPIFTEDDLGIGADPSKVEEKLNNLVNERVQPFIVSTLQKTSEENARNIFTNETEFPYAKRFQREILMAASNMDVSQTANPATWRNLYNYIVGANHSVLLEEAKRNNPNPKPKAPAAEKGNNGSKSSRVSSKGEDADFEARVKDAKLSPEQKMVAESMGITEDDFIRQALRMGYVLNGKL